METNSILDRPRRLPVRSDISANTRDYRPDIDGLRAVAVLLVVFFHAGFAEVSGGFVGVDIFFVISGYLITRIITRELDDGHFSFADFYARRMKRICPALFVALALSTVAGLVLLLPLDLRSFGRSIVSAVFFYANWHFYTQAGYFDGPAIEKPLLHTWSLAVEEQFYLIWPVAVFALYRAFGRQALPHIIPALLGVSLAASQIVLGQDQAQAFYLLPYRTWELLLGAFLAVAPLPLLSRSMAILFGLTGLCAIAYAALAFDAKTSFPGVNALFPCLGAAMLIAAGSQQDAWSRRILGFGPLRFVGKISYSLYLIHWPLLSFAHLAYDRAPTLGERLAIIAASFFLAALSWRYIETPPRQTRLRFKSIAWSTASAAALLVLCGVFYNATNGLPGRVSKSVLIATEAMQRKRPTRDKADCRADAKPPLPGIPCPIGAATSDLQYDFIIWGDSHALHLASAFSEQAQARGLAGLVVYVEACPPLINENHVSDRCKSGTARIEAWLKTQTKLKTVFLAGYWSAYADDGTLVSTEEGDANGGHPGLKDTLRLLRSLNMEAALVEDVPIFPRPVPLCTARARMFGRPDDQCLAFSRRDFERNAERAFSILGEISRNHDVPLISTAHAFCDAVTCRAERNGVIFYRDYNHLNTAGARYLGSKINIPWPESPQRQINSAELRADNKLP